MHFRTHKVILNNTKIFDFFENFEIFLSPHSRIFFLFFSRKKMVHCTFQMILSRFKKKKSIFFFEILLSPGPDTLDFGSSWRPYRTSNGHALLVVASLYVDK